MIAAANSICAQAIIVRMGVVSRAVIESIPTLRIIAKHGVGVDGIDRDAASSRGIPVVVAGGANAQSVAEQALALMQAGALFIDMTTADPEQIRRAAAIAAEPDAIVILAFDETKSIVPELKSQGWDMSKVYMSDGNTADYSADFDPGTLEGAKGTIPGADASADFKAKLVAGYQASEGGTLADFSYAAESYDAVILTALAAQAGGGTDAGTIQANMAAVSGANGGTECTTFADCKTALDAGDDIHYTGPSGIGPFNDDNDPSSASIGVYQFDADNKPVYQTGIEGSVG